MNADTFPFFTVEIAWTPTTGGEPPMVRVPAMGTDTPGLVITPNFNGGSIDGLWAVTHANSGQVVIPYGFDIDLADAFATRLGELPISWNADMSTVMEQAAACMEQLNDLLAAAVRDDLSSFVAAGVTR